jgi:CrcB protein
VVSAELGRGPPDWLRGALLDGLPPGTTLVNVLGCALFGLAFALSEGRFRDLASFRLILLGGFMGAFTTFSTYAYETVRLLEQGRIAVALANVLVQNGLGMGALVLGLSLGKGS